MQGDIWEAIKTGASNIKVETAKNNGEELVNEFILTCKIIYSSLQDTVLIKCFI